LQGNEKVAPRKWYGLFLFPLPNGKAQREPGLSAIGWSRLL
jgi:hypothetical protein